MRFRAVDAVESGVYPERMWRRRWAWAGVLVNGWLAKYREGGREALRARPVPGAGAEALG